MLKQMIKYKDFDGNPQEREYQFHLSQAELAELDVSSEGGLAKYCKEIAETKDGDRIMTLFKKMLRLSVGRKSPDGQRFDKSDKITSDFMYSNAYTETFTKLVTDAEYAAKFVNGLVA